MEAEFQDYRQISSVVARLVHHIDMRRWAQLRTIFSDVVETDYTSLFGGEPQVQDADALIETWRKLLTPLDSTQHLLGLLETETKNGTAVAHCHVRAYHNRKGLSGGSEWMVAGQYEFGFTEDAGSWKIRRIKLNTFYQTGNKNLLDEASTQ
jgi:hypothetical protein